MFLRSFTWLLPLLNVFMCFGTQLFLQESAPPPAWPSQKWKWADSVVGKVIGWPEGHWQHLELLQLSIPPPHQTQPLALPNKSRGWMIQKTNDEGLAGMNLLMLHFLWMSLCSQARHCMQLAALFFPLSLINFHSWESDYCITSRKFARLKMPVELISCKSTRAKLDKFQVVPME